MFEYACRPSAEPVSLVFIGRRRRKFVGVIRLIGVDSDETGRAKFLSRIDVSPATTQVVQDPTPE